MRRQMGRQITFRQARRRRPRVQRIQVAPAGCVWHKGGIGLESGSRGRPSRDPPWREQVERYHYLGCCVPFGAHLRYWVRNRERELACSSERILFWRKAVPTAANLKS